MLPHFITLSAMPPTAPTHIEFIARALILHRGHCLVCWNPEGNYGYLPGGHIEIGEPAPEALAREMIEETALACRVGPLLLTHENQFKTKKRLHHELNLVFAAEITDRSFLADDAEMCHVAQLAKALIPTRQKGLKGQKGLIASPPPVASAEPRLAFKWLSAAQFKRALIRPDPMAKWVSELLATGLDSTVGMLPTTAPAGQWLSTMVPK